MKKSHWTKELETELAFWERWIKGDGLDTAKALSVRIDPERPFAGNFEPFLNPGVPTNRILDVGSGPLTTLGFKSKVSDLDICAVDPLADAYVELIDRLEVAAPVRPQQASGEALTEVFPENSFDVAFACNALDHSYDPMKCIEEMIRVTKPGGHVVLQHNEREGSDANWHGLHQWDFMLDDGRFTICPNEGTAQDVVAFFGDCVEVVEARRIDVVVLVKSRREPPKQFVVALKKTSSEVPAWGGWKT